MGDSEPDEAPQEGEDESSKADGRDAAEEAGPGWEAAEPRPWTAAAAVAIAAVAPALDAATAKADGEGGAMHEKEKGDFKGPAAAATGAAPLPDIDSGGHGSAAAATCPADDGRRAMHTLETVASKLPLPLLLHCSHVPEDGKEPAAGSGDALSCCWAPGWLTRGRGAAGVVVLGVAARASGEDAGADVEAAGGITSSDADEAVRCPKQPMPARRALSRPGIVRQLRLARNGRAGTERGKRGGSASRHLGPRAVCASVWQAPPRAARCALLG